MIKYASLILLGLILSCANDSSDSQQTDETNEMYHIIARELEYDSNFLQEKIDSISNQTTDSLKLRYIEYTGDYLKFNEKLIKDFHNSDNLKDDLPEFESQFDKQTLEYKNRILQIVENPDFKKKINRVIDLRDITNREGQDIRYFQYIFSGKSGLESAVYLTLKENQILKLTSEYLNPDRK
ncbi:MAG: hypothetical protein ABJ092_14625 [Gillisia sp.]